MFKIAVLVSGGGSNLQAIIDNIENKYLNCKVEYVVSDNEKALAIERAKKYNIKTLVLPKKILRESISDEILKFLQNDVDLIVLAGFLSILQGDILEKFKNRIINIHPSLIPSFCGKGMYGIKVHDKAIQYGVKVSGCTVHFVDEGTDTGNIILQRTVPVYDEDTPEKLQKRVLLQEHKALPEAIKLLIEKKVEIKNGKVIIRED